MAKLLDEMRDSPFCRSIELDNRCKAQTPLERRTIMNQKNNGFENHRFTYLLSQIFMGWPLTALGFLVWCFNVIVLRKKPFGKFAGSLSLLEFSPGIRGIRNESAGWQALHIIYNYYGHFGIKPDLPRDPFAWFWVKMLNAQAVRNRLRIIVIELKEAIRAAAESDHEVRILSIASGSAQSLFMAIKALEKKGFRKKVSLLLDLDQTALDHSVMLADRFGFPRSRIISVTGSTASVEETINVNGFRPHIVEMAGFLDYRPDKKAVELMSRIHCLLPTENRFITCHIHPNLERHFLRWVLCWPMVYRTKDNFLRLIQESAGWSIRRITEPHGIHTVAVCTKKL